MRIKDVTVIANDIKSKNIVVLYLVSLAICRLSHVNVNDARVYILVF